MAANTKIKAVIILRWEVFIFNLKIELPMNPPAITAGTRRKSFELNSSKLGRLAPRATNEFTAMKDVVIVVMDLSFANEVKCKIGAK